MFFRFAYFLIVIVVGLTCAPGTANVYAQLPTDVFTTEPKDTATKAVPEESLVDWQANIKDRLTAAEAKSTQAKEAGEEPSAAVKRELEVLVRIDLSLSQLAEEQKQSQQLKEERQQLQEQLDELIQQGMNEDDPKTFQQLDLIREELRSEQQRLQRIVEKEEAASTALEKSQEDLKEKNTKRLLTKEKTADNRDDNLRRSLGLQLAEANAQSELSRAIERLRRQELLNARASRELQELQIKLLKEKSARLLVVVKFGPAELSQLFEELDRQEYDLKNRIAKFESAAEPRIRYVEEQWFNARQQFDATSGDKSELQERIKAFELEHQVLRKIPPLLRMQIDLLNRDRKVWRYRQRVFNTRPDQEIIQKWKEETTEGLAQVKREEHKAIFEIEELQEQIDAVEEKHKVVERDSLEEEAIGKQLESLRSLLNSHEESLENIRTSLWLHERLLNEIEGDSLAATAKDKLHSLWNGILAVWNYELTRFGEPGSADERTVTVQKVVTAVLVLLAGIFFSRVLSRALRRQVLRRLDIDPSASATIQSLFFYVLILLFSLFALSVAKVPLTAFTVLGGAVALGIGFGSQNIINNFISGLILLAERPVKVGDLIQLDNLNGDPLYGNIEHIGARSTRVRTGSNLEIIVPNSSFLQNNVVNFTLSSDKVRTMVEVGVIYGSPTVTVTQLLRRAVIETGRVSKDPPPIILFKSFGDNSLHFEVHFWIRMRTMMDQMQIESAVRFRIDQLFREEGITIAFPQRDVHLDTTSPLTIQMVDSSDSQT